ncbi:hypothetical protein OBBRIDRAFT_417706 [Obba rivulosa]|uniref:Uncharacterized protein n=1 Tax=Obba rivulosa TaxID=1052685 RepID=A0A8E2B2K8_9APHY|nr:hypothetical protein OBBRIDRAFT_417706 [Obba rivulosa]
MRLMIVAVYICSFIELSCDELRDFRRKQATQVAWAVALGTLRGTTYRWTRGGETLAAATMLCNMFGTKDAGEVLGLHISSLHWLAYPQSAP